ncbi:hypothetical protein IQ249_11560 [Lusitaniella coriacea LEGE 07157]|uniref:Uncharacterized protein n=1 Tax=Lusitaniella coriacea LEGE 07157 TaxID=945747 RepID=A0A8J7DWN7_9CYAN|nr:hypothetical protein [Lusitaniella coriacea]MBE9116536.1 hypothetical protein [Lusitaniella coriacea LEGE 07157]
MKPKIKFISSPEKAFENYYDTVSLSSDSFSFLSPSNFADWCSKAAKWLCEGNRIGEIGIGKGELAQLTVSYADKSLYFILIDLSSEMLNITRQKIEEEENFLVLTKYLKLNISKKQSKHLYYQNLDKLIAVNMLQDTDALESLLNMKLLLRKGGEIRLTFISKETQDVFSEEDNNYDSEQGIWYACSSFHEEKKVTPLGYFQDKEGKEKPFYRINRFYTRRDACELLKNAGFKVKSVEQVIYPLDYVWQRWKSQYHSMKLTKRQLELLDYWKGYPDGWDIIATLI